MGFHKFRFVFIWILLFSVLTYFFYSTEYTQFKLENQRSFKRILVQKNSILQGIKKDEPFPNYDAKIKLCELVSLEYIGQVKEILKNKDWKSQLKDHSNVFGSASGLIVGKKNKKFLQKFGNDFEVFFGKKWYKRFFLALRTKGTYFEGMIERIYPYAISHEDFMKRKDLFTILYKNGQFVLFLHTEVENKSIFYMLHLDKIQYTQLINETNKLFIRGNPNLATSKTGDIFSINDEKKIESEDELGLLYDLKYPNYFEWLVINYYLLVLGLIIMGYLHFTGGYRIYSVGIEYVLFIVTIAFTMFLNYLNFNIFHYWRANTIRSDTFVVQKVWKNKAKKIDANFDTFSKNIINNIESSFKDQDLIKLSKKNKDWLIFSVNSNLETMVYPKDTKIVSSILVQDFSKEIIRLNTEKEKTSVTVANLKNLRTNHGNIIAKSLIKKNYYLIQRKAMQVFRHPPKLFSKWEEYKDGYYVYWSKLKDWNRLGNFVLVMIPVPAMIDSYLKSDFMTNRKVMIRSKNSKKVIYPSEGFVVPLFDLQKQWLQTQNSGDLSSGFQRNSKEYTSLFVESMSLEDHHFFFTEQLDNLQSKISKTKEYYLYLQIIIWLCALFLSNYLRKILIKPLNDARLFLTKIRSLSSEYNIPTYFPKNLGQINVSIDSLYYRYEEVMKSDRPVDETLINIVESFKDGEAYNCVSLQVSNLQSDKELYNISSKYSAYTYCQTNSELTLLYFEAIHSNYMQNALQTAIELQSSNTSAKFLIYTENRVYNCISYETESVIYMHSTQIKPKKQNSKPGSILIDFKCCDHLKYNYEFRDYSEDFKEFSDGNI